MPFFVEDVLLCKAIHPDVSCRGNSLASAAFLFNQIKASMLSVDPLAMKHTSQWNIVIEEYLKMFGTSSFRTQGLFLLAEINGIIQFKCWETFGSPPLIVHPSTARSLLSVESAGNRHDTKNEVLKYVQRETQDMIQWPMKKHGSGLSDDCYDMADAYVIARAGIIQHNTQTILQKQNVRTNEWMLSPFVCEYIKANIAHFLRKHIDDDRFRTLESIPQDVLQVATGLVTYVKRYLNRLEHSVRDVVCTLCCSVWLSYNPYSL